MSADLRWHSLSAYVLGTGIVMVILLIVVGFFPVDAGTPFHRWAGFLLRVLVVMWVTCQLGMARRLLHIGRGQPVRRLTALKLTAHGGRLIGNGSFLFAAAAGRSLCAIRWTACMERRELIASLASTIAALHRPHPLRVAIDGVDASGKTTLANELAPSIEILGRPVLRASIDGFHNPAATRRRRGPTSPEGYFHDSFNHDALIEALLQPLGPGGSLAFRREVFDFRSDQPVEAPLEHAQPDSVLIFDGVFLLRPELRDHFDFSIFLRADFRVTVARAEDRDLHLFGSIQEIRQRYDNRYVPGQRLYLAEVQPERWASVVINNNDPLRPIIEYAV